MGGCVKGKAGGGEGRGKRERERNIIATDSSRVKCSNVDERCDHACNEICGSPIDVWTD